jgi:hypothetical protein
MVCDLTILRTTHYGASDGQYTLMRCVTKQTELPKYKKIRERYEETPFITNCTTLY